MYYNKELVQQNGFKLDLSNIGKNFFPYNLT